MNEEEKVLVLVHIRNNATGEIRIHNDGNWSKKDIDEGYFSFQYGENNYACDCNRSLFFARANAEEDSDRDGDRECTSYKFSITQCLLPDSTDIYHDEDEPLRETP